jgi:carbon storage regulator
MLVIRRREGERLLIGPDVEIEVLEIGGGHVKLGLHAPKSVLILRQEVYLTRIQNEAAAGEISTLELTRLADRFRK